MLGHSSRAGGGTPPRTPPRAPVVCLVTVSVSCLDTVAVKGGKPSRTPPSSTPLGAGSQISSRAWTQQPCRGEYLSRAWTQQPCKGGIPPPGPPLEHAPWCWVTDFVSCLDTAAVPGGGNPPGLPPRARPLVLGHRFIYLFLTFLFCFKQPIMPFEDRLFYRGRVRSAMAIRKGIHISGHYDVESMNDVCLFIYVLCILKD